MTHTTHQAVLHTSDLGTMSTQKGAAQQNGCRRTQERRRVLYHSKGWRQAPLKSNSRSALLVWEPATLICGRHLFSTSLPSAPLPAPKASPLSSKEDKSTHINRAGITLLLFCSLISHGLTSDILILVLIFQAKTGGPTGVPLHQQMKLPRSKKL